ncbi:10370_t:CDS:1, partial [Acaulospora colombiana]
DHTLGHGLVHGGETTLVGEIVGVAERGLLGGAECGGDGVVGGHTSNVGLGVGDDFAVLDVEAADLVEGTAGGAVARQELGDDGELGVGVDGQAGAVVGGVAHTVRVEVASVLVAHSTVAVGAVPALGARAAVLAVDGAAVGGVGSSVLVGLPDIHLVTARSVVALAGVDVVGGWGPALY